jgi:hypothetical protein
MEINFDLKTTIILIQFAIIISLSGYIASNMVIWKADKPADQQVVKNTNPSDSKNIKDNTNSENTPYSSSNNLNTISTSNKTSTSSNITTGKITTNNPPTTNNTASTESPNNSINNTTTTPSSPTITKEIKKDDIIKIKIISKQFSSIYGYQLELKFDKASFEFDKNSLKSNISDMSLIMSADKNYGILIGSTKIGNKAGTSSENSPICELQLKALKSGTSNISVGNLLLVNDKQESVNSSSDNLSVAIVN